VVFIGDITEYEKKLYYKRQLDRRKTILHNQSNWESFREKYQKLKAAISLLEDAWLEKKKRKEIVNKCAIECLLEQVLSEKEEDDSKIEEEVREESTKEVREGTTKEAREESTKEVREGTTKDVRQETTKEYVEETTKEYVEESTKEYVEESTKEYLEESTKEITTKETTRTETERNRTQSEANIESIALSENETENKSNENVFIKDENMKDKNIENAATLFSLSSSKVNKNKIPRKPSTLLNKNKLLDSSRLENLKSDLISKFQQLSFDKPKLRSEPDELALLTQRNTKRNALYQTCKFVYVSNFAKNNTIIDTYDNKVYFKPGLIEEKSKKKDVTQLVSCLKKPRDFDYNLEPQSVIVKRYSKRKGLKRK
jgi:hypothetical protein